MNSPKRYLLNASILLILSIGGIACNPTIPEPVNWHNEVIYHVMPRSFFDSNGDRHGDLNGFVEKLDYLQELGVTTILFTPLYESGFYHNYFPTDYEKIDPEYGSMEDYINFVKAVHQRGMRFLMDMETQYVQSGHRWFDESYLNPSSPYSDFILYTDAENRYPEQIFMPTGSDLHFFKASPDSLYNIALLDLSHPTVKEWMSDFYAFWVDPNGDGVFDDGVDGFRLDHIMDDLDHKGLLTNLYEDFWQPIFERCREINPNIFLLGEQANWAEYGDEMIAGSGADAAFGFPLRFAMAGKEVVSDMYDGNAVSGEIMQPAKIHEAALETTRRFPEGTYSITFVENHDTDRWASIVGGHLGQMRAAAVLNLLLPGVPSIYYGQELGLTGVKGDWGSDGNHLPIREAFPWTSDPDNPGMATFYKETGPWWDQSFYLDEAIQQLTLPNQRSNEASLWNHYRELIAIRKAHDAFMLGDYTPVYTEHEGLLAFVRTLNQKALLVLLNVSERELQLDLEDLVDESHVLLYGGTELVKQNLSLKPYAYAVLQP